MKPVHRLVYNVRHPCKSIEDSPSDGAERPSCGVCGRARRCADSPSSISGRRCEFPSKNGFRSGRRRLAAAVGSTKSSVQLSRIRPPGKGGGTRSPQYAGCLVGSGGRRSPTSPFFRDRTSFQRSMDRSSTVVVRSAKRQFHQCSTGRPFTDGTRTKCWRSTSALTTVVDRTPVRLFPVSCCRRHGSLLS